MISQKPELIWQGRIQLGDEPGTFTDASYSGLSLEFPLTVRNTGAVAPDDLITFFLEAQNVDIFSPYPGHLVTVYYYKPAALPNQWTQNVYKQFRLVRNRLQIDVDLTGLKPAAATTNIYLSIAVEVDTSVAPGLYNDFVVVSLRAISDQYKYVANFGFDYY